MEGFTEKAGAGGVGRQWWSFAAVLCLAAGGALLLLGRQDWAFAAAVLGVVAWFMNVRAQLHRENVGRDAERAGDGRVDVTLRKRLALVKRRPGGGAGSVRIVVGAGAARGRAARAGRRGRGAGGVEQPSSVCARADSAALRALPSPRSGASRAGASSRRWGRRAGTSCESRIRGTPTAWEIESAQVVGDWR